LKHNWHIGGVEESHWIASAHATLTGTLHWYLHAETLEVDYSREDRQSSQQVHHVWQVLSVECFTEGSLFVGPSQEEVDTKG
jgi:hypothetical protein